MKNRRTWTAILIFLLAVALRVYRLDTVPPPINQDEAVHAYDARCLLALGTDHYGARWPIFFRAFRDFHPGPFVYLLIPLQAIFGMNVWTTRLPGALIGSVGVWFLYLLIRRVYDDRVAALAAIFLAVSPWHLHLSRLAFEASTCPTLAVLALLLLVVAVRRRDERLGVSPQRGELFLWFASGIVLGLVSWIYHAMRVFIPLLLLGLVVNYRKHIRRFMAVREFRSAAIAWTLGLLGGLFPFLWVWAWHPDEAWARAASVSIFHAAAGFMDTAAQFLQNYARNVSPDFYFVEGDHSLIQSVGGYGQLHYYCVLLIPLGLYRAVRRWGEEPFSRLAVWWVLISPIPASLAISSSGHCLRSVGGLPAYQILAALGADFALSAALRHSRRRYRASLLAGSLAVALNVAYFLRIFFVQYPIAAAKVMQSEWREVVAEVQRRKKDYDAVVLSTTSTNQLGMLYLFWSNLSPRDYFAGPPVVLRGPFFDQIVQIGDVYFMSSDVLPHMTSLIGRHRKFLVAERPKIAVPGRALRHINYPDGRVAVILYDVRAEDLPTAGAPALENPSQHRQ